MGFSRKGEKMVGLARCSAALRLPTLGYTFVFPLGYALSRGCSCAVPLAPRDLHLICGVSVKRLQTTGDLQGGRGRSVDLFAFGL